MSIFLYCWRCRCCCVSCYLYFEGFIFFPFVHFRYIRYGGIDVASILINLSTFGNTLVTVGPLRYEMLIFPIHLSFILFHRDVLCANFFCSLPFESQTQREYQVEKTSVTMTVLYPIYTMYTYNKFVFCSTIVVVVVFRVISAFKEKKESIILLHCTLLYFSFLYFTSHHFNIISILKSVDEKWHTDIKRV